MALHINNIMENKKLNEPAEPAPVNKKGCSCLAALTLLFIFLVVAVGAILVFPTPVLRLALPYIEAKTGMAVSFESVRIDFEGFFLNIDGLAVKRQNHHASNYDLKVEKVRVPVRGLVEPSFLVLSVSGLRGTYEKIGSESTEKTDNSEHKESTASEKTYMKSLMLQDVQVDFIDRTLEKPFQATIQVEKFVALKTNTVSLFEPYACLGNGQISSATLAIVRQDDRPRIALSEVPFGLLSPYAPVLDDIFVSGGMNIVVDDFSNETQKKLRVNILLLPDCRIKSADEILAPAIQAALQKLDQSSIPALRDVKEKIDRLKTTSESLRTELDKVAQIVDTLKVLAPRDVREKYENFKSRYDRARASYNEWDTKFETLLRELDQVKVGIVNDTFRHFIESGTPIEIELQQVNGEWQYDWYEVVVRLIERNYQMLIATQYQRRIQEILDSVDRLLAP